MGSDHTPLMVDTGAIQPPKNKQFRFEKWWLEVEGFEDMVKKCWNAPCSIKDPLDRWQYKSGCLEEFVKAGMPTMRLPRKKTSNS